MLINYFCTAVSAYTRLGDKFVDKAVADVRVSQRLTHKVSQIYDLGPAETQRRRELVMLALRSLKERDIVKKKPVKILRHEIVKLMSRPEKKDLLQRLDLRVYVDRSI